MRGLSIFILILVSIFIIIFTVDFFRFKRKLKSNIKYGVFLGIILIVLDMINIISNSGILLSFAGFAVLIGIILVLLRTIVCVSVGNYYCSILRINDIPLIRKFFNYREGQNTDDTGKEGLLDHADNEEFEKYYDRDESIEIIEHDKEIEYEEEIQYKPCTRIDWKKYLLWTLIVLIGGIAYSIILLKVTSPEASDLVKEMIEKSGGLKDVDIQTILMICIAVFAIALNEEIIFRLAIQNFFASKFKLKGKKYWIAVVLTSFLWTLAHAGALNPEWVKFAQIFPIGIALGYLFKKFGIESCMIVHGLFNVILAVLSIQGFIKI